jgi:hypothetical protein
MCTWMLFEIGIRKYLRAALKINRCTIVYLVIFQKLGSDGSNIPKNTRFSKPLKTQSVQIGLKLGVPLGSLAHSGNSV